MIGGWGYFNDHNGGFSFNKNEGMREIGASIKDGGETPSAHYAHPTAMHLK